MADLATDVYSQYLNKLKENLVQKELSKIGNLNTQPGFVDNAAKIAGGTKGFIQDPNVMVNAGQTGASIPNILNYVGQFGKNFSEGYNNTAGMDLKTIELLSKLTDTTGGQKPASVSDVTGLKDKFDTQAKQFITTLGSFNKLKSLGKQADPQAQMAMVFSFMKALDPQSTVREGEYQTARATTGLFGELSNRFQQLLDGGFLNEEQIRGFISAAQKMVETEQGLLNTNIARNKQFYESLNIPKAQQDAILSMEGYEVTPFSLSAEEQANLKNAIERYKGNKQSVLKDMTMKQKLQKEYNDRKNAGTLTVKEEQEYISAINSIKE